MWILYAFSSAFFAGITSILAKIGIKDTDSDVATALRTTVILGFSWASVFIMRIDNQLSMVAYRSLMYLILSGFSTGASWICYFRALQLGNINKIVPIDKSSVILTMLLTFIFLKEPISIFGIIAMLTIGIETYLMIQTSKCTRTNK
jgi:transporter family protein